MTIKLLALDLDGTLLKEDLSLAPRVRQALEAAQARGIRLTLASGRGYPSMRRWAEKLGITTPVIGYQGAVITDPVGGHRVYQCTFPRQLVRELAQFARACDLTLTLYVADEIYLERKHHPDDFYAKWFGLPYHVVPDVAAALPDDPEKFLFIGTKEELDAIRPALEAQFADRLQIMRSHDYFLEGAAPGATKGSALAWLAEKLSIAQAETMAIGDSGNDAAMIAWAGVGVAMGNASAEALAVADYVAPTVDDDGVAEAIERFCL